MNKKGIIIEVFGRVQGVGFRYYAQKKARELGISGYVKNIPDGSVHIEAEGNDEAVEQYLSWCEDGPGWARVSHLNKQWVPVQGYHDFEIR